MKTVISPVSKSLMEQELTKDRFVKTTNYGSNEIYILDYHNSPNVVREIGRLREVAFRNAGGGTGKEIDIDNYDTGEDPYQQLIVWSPQKQELLGGYRFLDLSKAKKDKTGKFDLATNRLFNFSDNFEKNYLPYTIELGRSFVQPRFQASKAGREALFALDNLWDGLGALIMLNKHIKYFFGKVTMYTHFNQTARDYILYFIKKHFPDNDKLVYPMKPIEIKTDLEILKQLFTEDEYKKDHRILSRKVRDLNENIPPLINSYMNLSPTMKVFGTALNDHFGDVEETGIMITIPDIFDTKKKRHVGEDYKF